MADAAPAVSKQLANMLADVVLTCGGRVHLSAVIDEFKRVHDSTLDFKALGFKKLQQLVEAADGVAVEADPENATRKFVVCEDPLMIASRQLVDVADACGGRVHLPAVIDEFKRVHDSTLDYKALGFKKLQQLVEAADGVAVEADPLVPTTKYMVTDAPVDASAKAQTSLTASPPAAAAAAPASFASSAAAAAAASAEARPVPQRGCNAPPNADEPEPLVCAVCEALNRKVVPAAWQCIECEATMCNECDANEHTSLRTKGHTRTKVEPSQWAAVIAEASAPSKPVARKETSTGALVKFVNPITKKESLAAPVTYVEGQWSPSNPDGAKAYDKDFMMTLRPVCVRPPPNFVASMIPTGPAARQRSPDISSRGRGSQAFAVPGFNPGDFDGSGGWRLASGAPAARGSGGGPCGVDFDGGGSIALPAREAPKLNKAENGFDLTAQKGAAAAKVDKNMLYEARMALNKLTLENFDKLSQVLLDHALSDLDKLSEFVEMVFNRAIDEPGLHAKLCRSLSDSFRDRLMKQPGTDKEEKVSTVFKSLLLNNCQKQFDGAEDLMVRAKAESPTELEKARRHVIGSITFISELFLVDIVTESVLRFCIDMLLTTAQKKDETKERKDDCLEQLCKLLETAGAKLERKYRKTTRVKNGGPKTKGPELWEETFKTLEALTQTPGIAAQIKDAIQSILDMRRDGWKARTSDNGPKTIEGIHKEAQNEAIQSVIAEEKHPRSSRGRPPPQPKVDAHMFDSLAGKPVGGLRLGAKPIFGSKPSAVEGSSAANGGNVDGHNVKGGAPAPANKISLLGDASQRTKRGGEAAGAGANKAEARAGVGASDGTVAAAEPGPSVPIPVHSAPDSVRNFGDATAHGAAAVPGPTSASSDPQAAAAYRSAGSPPEMSSHSIRRKLSIPTWQEFDIDRTVPGFKVLHYTFHKEERLGEENKLLRSSVYKGRLTLAGTDVPVAIKRFELPSEDGEEEDRERASKQVQSEVKILMESSEWIVDIHDVVGEISHQGRKFALVVMEYCGLGNLGEWMETGKRSFVERRNIVQQLVRAYADIHRFKICHRDVKADNIVLSERDGLFPLVRLCDFALAKKVGGGEGERQTMFTYVGTNITGMACWMAPEVLNGDGYRISCDVWSLGCLILFVASNGRHVFTSDRAACAAEKDEKIMHSAIDALEIDPVEFPHLTGLASRMLQPVEKRVTAAWAATHPAVWTDNDIESFLHALVSEFRGEESGDHAAARPGTATAFIKDMNMPANLRRVLPDGAAGDWVVELPVGIRSALSHSAAPSHWRAVITNQSHKRRSKLTVLLTLFRNCLEHFKMLRVPKSSGPDIRRTTIRTMLGAFPELIPLAHEVACRHGEFVVDGNRVKFEFSVPSDAGPAYI